MNILVVGNGFDLAHGLPTRYSDFLDYLTLYIIKYEVSRRMHLYNTWGGNSTHWQNYTPTLRKIYDRVDKNSKVKNLFKETSEQFKTILEEESLNKFYENTFVRYCLYAYSYKQTFDREFNWIDIENELLNFLIELHAKEITQNALEGLSVQLLQRQNETSAYILFYMPTIFNALKSKEIPPELFCKAVFDQLFKELEDFNSLLKFYLKLVQENFKRDAKKIFQINVKDTDGGYHGIFIDGIVSFNYTDTAKIYVPEAKIHFINGSLVDEKIILGVENPLPEKTRDYCNDDIHLFFKNVQRVLYDFSYDYRNLFSEIGSRVRVNGQNTFITSKHVYIMGHSLAVSDKYVLTDLMMNSNDVTIYYYNEQDKYDKTANLYTLLGDELFSKHVNNPASSPSIRLVDQNSLLDISG